MLASTDLAGPLAAHLLAFSLAMPPWWGFVIAIVIVILGGVVATSFSSPNMAAVGITPDDRLLVRPVGLVVVWAFNRGIDVPVSAIVDVGVSPRKGLVKHFRLPGTHIPGIMTAGIYRSRSEKDLWMVGRAKELLVIELHDERFRHVIVQVEDPHAAVEALRAAINRER